MKKCYSNILLRKTLKLALTVGFFWLQIPYEATAQHWLPNLARASVLKNNPAQPGQRVAATISVPGNSDDYFKISGGWVLNSQSTYRYNLDGKLLSRLSIYLNSSQVTKSKDSLNYDAHGRVIFKAHYQYYNNAWNTSSGLKYLTTYNSSGQLTEIITTEHAAGIWSNIRREVTTYHTNGSPLEVTSYNWANNAWQPSGKQIYTYGTASNAPTEILGQLYQNNSWVNESRINNLTWHNFSRLEALNFTTEVWLNNGWENYYKTTIAYDAFGGYISTWQQWLNNNWKNDQQTSVSYDNKLNFIGDKLEIWQNNNWVINQENQEILTYNGNDDITERIYRDWDNFNNVYREDFRSVYSNFRNISGIKKESCQLKVSVYPNPASDKIQIQLAESKSQTLTVSVEDITGKILQTQTFKAGEAKQLNLEALPKGIYLLQLQTGTGSSVKRIVKQ